MKKIRHIVLFLRTLSDPYQLAIFKSISQTAKDKGLLVWAVQSERIDHTFSFDKHSACKFLKFFEADGVIFLSSAMFLDGNMTTERLKNCINNLPCVSVGYNYSGIPSILIRNRISMTNIVEHLIKVHGYKTFLFIGGEKYHNDNMVRESVFKRTIKRYAEKFPDIHAEYAHCNWSEHQTFAFMKDYLARHPNKAPDAIVAANDNMAIGVLKFLRSVHEPAWQNVAVTGYDDIPQSASEIPALTTVSQPLQKLGAAAVLGLKSLMEGETVPMRLHIDTEVRIRNSCGCAVEPLKDKKTLDYKNEYAPNYQFRFKADYYLNIVSTFAQELTDIDSIPALCASLSGFLNMLEVPIFYLFSFSKQNNQMWYETGSAQLIYSRTAINEVYNNFLSEHINLKDFFHRDFPSDVRSIFLLRAGQKEIGFVLFEIDPELQPYICSAFAFIENVLRRVSDLETEKQHSALLEKEIQLRSKALVAVHEKLKQEAERRLAVEAEVLRISELERLRFSIDLHDDICQRLAGISLYCKSLLKMEELPTNALPDLASLIDETLTRTRAYAHDFFPLELDSVSLKEALFLLCESSGSQMGLHCDFEWLSNSDTKFHTTQKLNIYRIFQEALHNVSKHAKARKAVLRVTEESKGTLFELIDDGIGVEQSKEIAKKTRKKSVGLGMRSMEYRAHQIGAEYSIKPSVPCGTIVSVMLPNPSV
ncbi:MAG: substrate-binding domain-containing protein [Treponema sp.]|nr:substrate-binding domain-containing protein [Treponema sp.]